MARRTLEFDDDAYRRPFRGFPWQRWALAIALPVVAVIVFLLLTWNAFFKYVPPGKILVLVSKNGNALPEGQVLADTGEKGVQRAVLGEGWHFVMPIVYTSELEGPDGDRADQGRRRHGSAASGCSRANSWPTPTTNRVSVAGCCCPRYRINPYGYTVEQAPAVEIKPGFVGVQCRLLGTDNTGRYADNPGEKGILATCCNRASTTSTPKSTRSSRPRSASTRRRTDRRKAMRSPSPARTAIRSASRRR